MMTNDVIIINAEDDEGHALLIRKNLQRAGLANKIIHFTSGQRTLDFFFKKGDGPHWEPEHSYLLLLDIRMPGIDGLEVLRHLKQDPELRKIPVLMVTTTDDPREIEHCHALGCNNYITKPIEYKKFVEKITQLGLFLMLVEIPKTHRIEEIPAL